MIHYTKNYYLDTLKKGVEKLLNSSSIPVGQLEQMYYMIKELQEVNQEEWDTFIKEKKTNETNSGFNAREIIKRVEL